MDNRGQEHRNDRRRARAFGGVWQAFAEALSRRGYAVATEVVDAVNYGIAQYRKRSILLASRGAETLSVPIADNASERRAVRHAIGRFPPLAAGQTHAADPDHRAARVSDVNRLRLAAAKAGGTNLEYLGTSLEVGCHARLKDRLHRAGRAGGGYTDAYTRLHADRPSPTITTKCLSFSNGRFGHYDESQHRALSVREAAALQSFPDDFSFRTPSLASAAKMIGNALPPKLAAFLVRHLASTVRSSS